MLDGFIFVIFWIMTAPLRAALWLSEQLTLEKNEPVIRPLKNEWWGKGI